MEDFLMWKTLSSWKAMLRTNLLRLTERALERQFFKGYVCSEVILSENSYSM
jgi:transcription antitermination factor NusG